MSSIGSRARGVAVILCAAVFFGGCATELNFGGSMDAGAESDTDVLGDADTSSAPRLDAAEPQATEETDEPEPPEETEQEEEPETDPPDETQTDPLDAGAVEAGSATADDASASDSDAEAGTSPSVDPVLGPRLLGTAPPDNAVSVDPNSNLVFIFNEPVFPGGGVISVWEAGTDELFEAFDIEDSSVIVSDVTVTVTPGGPFEPGTEYYVTVSEGALLDAADGGFAGIADTEAFNFTTTENPPPPIALVGSVPAAGATDVPADTDLVFIFGEPVVVRAGNITVFRQEGDALVESVAVDTDAVVVMGDTVTVALSAVLDDNTEYYVTFGAGAIESERGASFDGIVDASTFSFTTDDPFILLGTDPVDGATNVGVRSQLTLTFSAPAEPGTGNLVVHAAGDIVESVPIDDARVSFDGATVVVQLDAPLVYDENHWVTLGDGAIVEVGGQGFGGIESPNTWNFQTLPPCADGEVPGDNGACFVVGVGTLDWEEARDACAAVRPGWGLSTIEDSQDQAAVAAILDAEAPGAEVWIGATDAGDEGVWLWASTGEQFWEGGASGSTVGGLFENWKSDQPTGSGQDCARLVPEGSDYLWADDPCTESHEYLCQGPTQ